MVVRKDTNEQFAIKFFLSEAAYKEEIALYQKGRGTRGGQISQFLPQVCVTRSTTKDVHCTSPLSCPALFLNFKLKVYWC